MTKINIEPRVGVDIGGTFTDVSLMIGTENFTCKVLTNYSEPEQAILDGIIKAAKQANLALPKISQIIHGTTLVTNSLIERRGAKTAFITTDGFRDVVEMRNENRFEQYDLDLVLPQPLVARPDRFTIKERVAADGDVLMVIDPAELETLVTKILEGDYEAVAIGLIHSYANGSHEQQIADAIKKVAPELSVSLSSVVSPQMREFQRFNTVIANAYVQPQVSDYLGRLVSRLKDIGVDAPVFMMHSAGGLISVETASEQPVRLLESGPAGGAIYAADFAESHDLSKVLSFDMGGTTAKICLIENGAPGTANSFEVARTYRFKKGSGMPVSTPVIEMVEIGAGGGSIAHVDDMGQIRVGPKSAASEPGPACYQRGGVEPTVTDANLLLGRLDPDNFAGGNIPLSVANSTAAFTNTISKKTELSELDGAFGVTEMVDENMANAARVHAVENGKDIQAYTMIAFGGGAPLHACRLCEKLDIAQLIIPPGAGVGSAIGFLKAPFSYEATKGLFQKLDEFDANKINVALEALEIEANGFVSGDSSKVETEIRLQAFMRYSGQGSEIRVNVPHRKFVNADVAEFQERFEEAYRDLFGRTIEDLKIEITNWSLTVSSVLPKPAKIQQHLSGQKLTGGGTRKFYDAALRKIVVAQEVDRKNITAGVEISGPAVVVESETSTIVTSAYSVVGQVNGSLLLIRKDTMEVSS
jgi:N-methylhydantoinase A